MNLRQRWEREVIRQKKVGEETMLILNLARYYKWPKSLSLRRNLFSKRGDQQVFKDGLAPNSHCFLTNQKSQ